MGNGCEGNCDECTLTNNSFLTPQEIEDGKWKAIENSMARDELTMGISGIIARRMVEVGDNNTTT